jgi:hypothetical protein
LFAIAGFYSFQKVIANESVTAFSQPEIIAELHLSAGFSSLDYLQVRVVQTQDFMLIG